jgi:hypothetical protein
MASYIKSVFNSWPLWLKGGLSLLSISVISTILYNFLNLNKSFFTILQDSNEALRWVGYMISAIILLMFAFFVALPNMVMTLCLGVVSVFAEVPLAKYLTQEGVGPVPYLNPPTVLGYILVYLILFGLGAFIRKRNDKNNVDVKRIFD